jgi:hypothetical protein
MKFNLTYDSSVNSAPAGFKTAVEAVAKFYEDHLLDPVTINLNVAFGPLPANVAGQNQASVVTSFSYDTIRTALANNATTPDDATAALPATDPISGAHNYVLSSAQQKVLGLRDANNPASDGAVTFSNTLNFDYDRSDGIGANSYDFAGVVAHEFSEIMGRTMNVGTTDAGIANSYTLLDLYHYSAPSTRDLTKTTGYFSFDNGKTPLDSFNIATGDAADWAGTVVNDSFGTSVIGQQEPVTLVDERELDVLGWSFAHTVFLNVATAAELAADIKYIDQASQYSGGTYDFAQDSGGVGTNFKITLAAGATLTEATEILAVNLEDNDTLTIDGQGATLDGAGAHRGLFVYAGNVTIQNLTIADTVARGGAGGAAAGAAAQDSAADCLSPMASSMAPAPRLR